MSYLLKNTLEKTLSFRIKEEGELVEGYGFRRIRLVPTIAEEVSDEDFKAISATGLFKHHKRDIDIEEIEQKAAPKPSEFAGLNKPELLALCEEKGLETEGLKKPELIELLENN